MQQFVSDISGKAYPIGERVNIHTIRGGIVKEIIKWYPAFNETTQLAQQELNRFRALYIEDLLAKEVGTLTQLEATVLENISQNHLITDDASDIKQKATAGQRWADRIASFGGSWTFISLFAIFLAIWIVLNITLLHNRGFDPYPFILLNLLLSCLAAIQAPIIMMSQNRQEEKDRGRARNDYMVNLKSELEIRMLHEKIDHILITQQQTLMGLQQTQLFPDTDAAKG